MRFKREVLEIIAGRNSMGARRGERYVGPYEVVMSHPVYENARLKLREDRVKRRDGRESTFGIVTINPGVTVLPMDQDGTVTLVREFKYAFGESTLEAVSGEIESGETPEQAGLREIGEEAWLVATVRRLASQAGIGMPEVAIFDSTDVNAFATGARRDSALVEKAGPSIATYVPP